MGFFHIHIYYLKNFYYNEDGTWGWTTQKNEVFEFYPSGKKSKETEYGRTYTYDQDGNEISCVRYENGILTGESWTEYDQHKEKCHYKSISYNNDGSLESIWEEITERDTDGNIIFYKLSDTSGKPENNYEYHYEFDSHGNHIRTKGNHPHWLNDLTYIFEYDENDNLIHYKNVYSDYEKWIEYDKDSFPTHLLLRDHTTSMFRASDNLSFYAEVFFVNKCTYHANGKVKDCVRYYYENPYYHQNDDYSYVLKRQKTANEHKANNVE